MVHGKNKPKCSGSYKLLHKKGIDVVLIVDEWCNSLEDVKFFLEANAVKMIQVKMPLYGGVHNGLKALLLCKQKGVMAYIGGSCTRPSNQWSYCSCSPGGNADWILARPGLGVDEGIMVVHNEMARTLLSCENNGQIVRKGPLFSRTGIERYKGREELGPLTFKGR